MKNEIVMNLRRFPVTVQDVHTQETRSIFLTLEKGQLQAAQIVGQSSKELIERLCGRQGFTVLDIGKPDKLAVVLGLDALWRRYSEEQEERDKWNYLYGAGGGEAGA